MKPAWMEKLDSRQLRARGQCDFLDARTGVPIRNDEIIVYNEAQSTIRYLTEIGA